MHVYHAVLAKENVQLEQSLQAMENNDIDATACVECGTCAGACPTGAIEQQ